MRRASGTPPGAGSAKKCSPCRCRIPLLGRGAHAGACGAAPAGQSILRQTSSRRVRLGRPGRTEAPDASVAANSSIPAPAGKRVARNWKQSRTHCAQSLRRGGLFAGAPLQKTKRPYILRRWRVPSHGHPGKLVRSGTKQPSRVVYSAEDKARHCRICRRGAANKSGARLCGRARLPAPLPQPSAFEP